MSFKVKVRERQGKVRVRHNVSEVEIAENSVITNQQEAEEHVRRHMPNLELLADVKEEGEEAPAQPSDVDAAAPGQVSPPAEDAPAVPPQDSPPVSAPADAPAPEGKE